MRMVFALAGLSAAALLSACTPAAQSEADEKAMRAEPPAMVEQDDKELPVLDAQGNELDPELADAVREKMEEEKAAREDGADDVSADDGAPTDDDQT